MLLVYYCNLLLLLLQCRKKEQQFNLSFSDGIIRCNLAVIVTAYVYFILFLGHIRYIHMSVSNFVNYDRWIHWYNLYLHPPSLIPQPFIRKTLADLLDFKSFIYTKVTCSTSIRGCFCTRSSPPIIVMILLNIINIIPTPFQQLNLSKKVGSQASPDPVWPQMGFHGGTVHIWTWMKWTFKDNVLCGPRVYRCRVIKWSPYST